MTSQKNRASDNTLFKSNSDEYIPIAYHYDDSTLVTKNGELIQTILIHGINSERISENLINLREMVRKAIREHIKSDKFAFWVHTVRKKTNLDDNATYSKFFSDNLHSIWKQKNYWNDKFVNTLYITIVYAAADLKISKLKAFLSSISYPFTKSFHEIYLKHAHEILNHTISKLIDNLKEFGAIKLSIFTDKEGSFSELLSLYSKIIHLSENKVILPCMDSSLALSQHQYAVGSNKIEVIEDDSKKFAAILSLKEYQDISAEELDKFLQLPIEMIASEIFYFIPKEQALKHIEHQEYILKISKDEELRQWKGFSNIIDSEESTSFCTQQINIMIIGEDIDLLEQDTCKASKALSKLGIMHVREDISLEQAFWAQLPGNFRYLKRLHPALIKDIASFSSLHNFPTGVQESPWGKFVTLLRTEKGTPYFMNFHNSQKIGHTAVFGAPKSGRTVLTNFLLSEATKFNPKILYLTKDTDSRIFVEALEGSWHEVSLGNSFINIFGTPDEKANREYLVDFVNIIFDKVSANSNFNEFAANFIDYISSLPIENRNLNYILENFNFEDLGAGNYKQILFEINKVEGLSSILTAEYNIDFEINNLTSFNFKELTEQDFEKNNYPSDPKQRTEYYNKLSVLNRIRSSVLLFLIHKFINLNTEAPKILVVEDFFELFGYEFEEIIEKIFNSLDSVNGIILASVDISKHDKLHESQVWRKFYSKLGTKIILASEVVLDNLDKLFELSRIEFKKLKSLKPLKRLFMIKQGENAIITELSLGGLPGILKILSAREEDIKLFQDTIAKVGNKAENWLADLYENFNKQP